MIVSDLSCLFIQTRITSPIYALIVIGANILSQKYFFSMDDLSQGIARQLAAGISTRVFPGDQAMLSIVTCEPNAEGLIHSHPQEQWGVCLAGSGVRMQAGEEVRFKQGDFWCTPGGVDHGLHAGAKGAKLLDVFAPPRDEYRSAGSGFASESAKPKAGCLFCHPKLQEVLDENELCLTLIDNHPVSAGHCLIVPKRHADDIFEMTPAEAAAAHQLLLRARQRLQNEDPSISGFNSGLNSGKSAGQSVFHAHMHVIPRRDGDHENPRGGVRHVFPNKARY